MSSGVCHYMLTRIISVAILFQLTFPRQFILGLLLTPRACFGNRTAAYRDLVGNTMSPRFVLSTLGWQLLSSSWDSFLFFWPGIPLSVKKSSWRGGDGGLHR